MNSKSIKTIGAMIGHRQVPTILHYMSAPDRSLKRSDFKKSLAAALNTEQNPSNQTELPTDCDPMEALTKEKNNE